MAVLQTTRLAELEKQRIVLNQKIADLKADVKENELVLEALADTDKSRRCMRMVGGVLVERTVEEVRVALNNHKDQINTLINSYETDLTKFDNEWKAIIAEISKK